MDMEIEHNPVPGRSDMSCQRNGQEREARNDVEIV